MENKTENFREPIYNYLSSQYGLTLNDSQLDEIISIASKIADEKRNEEVKEKYGIELILKEMWVWDGDRENANYQFVLEKYRDQYASYDNIGIWNTMRNASETDPRQNTIKESKIGDKGYFWDDENGFYIYDELVLIKKEHRWKYSPKHTDLHFINFSTQKQPWMR